MHGLLMQRIIQKRFKVRLELHPGRLVDVQHVPGFILRTTQVRPDRRFQIHRRDHGFRAEKRRR